MTVKHKNKKFDLVCLGRALVDLYAEQIGSRLEDVSSFAKYLGGSSCNIATGSSRLGLRAALITRVGDEHMGRFVRETLQKEGVDVTCVKTDKERLTALAILGIKDRETFPLIFYRDNCADMALQKEDFSEDFIASSEALLITGTHFSTPGAKEVSLAALDYATKNGVKKALDIDYRPVLWGLAGKGEGENRFVENKKVTTHLQEIVPYFDLIVGTEEEICITGENLDVLKSLRKIRSLSDAVLVLKRGPLGATVFDGEIPDTLDEGITAQGVCVEVLNVLGAGDAFISGFLRGWLRGQGYAACLNFANACGALVVSRHGCAPAMPSWAELKNYLQRSADITCPDKDKRLNFLHRVTTRHPAYSDEEKWILAFDHRKQFFDMVAKYDDSTDKIVKMKKMILQAVIELSDNTKFSKHIGILVDDVYGRDSLNEATGRNWWVGRPVEQPGSRPLEFQHGDNIGADLKSWPIEHIVKCLVHYHPDDDAELRYKQERKVKTLYQACFASGHELLLEIVPPRSKYRSADTVPKSLERFYNLGVYPDWWKLPPLNADSWGQIDKLIQNRHRECHGILILGLDAPMEKIAKAFEDVSSYSVIKGFAIGRAIFAKPSEMWLEGKIDDLAYIEAIKENYLKVVALWQQRKKDSGGFSST